MATLIKTSLVAEQEMMARGITNRAYDTFTRPVKRYFQKFGGIYHGTIWANSVSESAGHLLGSTSKDCVMLIDPFERMMLRLADVSNIANGCAALAYSDEVREVVWLDPSKVGKYKPKDFAGKHVLIRQVMEFEHVSSHVADLLEFAHSIHLGKWIVNEWPSPKIVSCQYGAGMDDVGVYLSMYLDKWVNHQDAAVVRGENRFYMPYSDRESIATAERRLEIVRGLLETIEARSLDREAEVACNKIAQTTLRYEDGDRVEGVDVKKGHPVTVTAEMIRQPGRGHWAISRAIANAGAVTLKIAEAGKLGKWSVHDWASSILCEWLKQWPSVNAALNQLTVVGASKLELEAIIEYVRRNGGENGPLID